MMPGRRGRSLQCLLAAAAGVCVADDAADTTSSSSTTVEVEVEHPHCRLFLAESTIPNAGLGIFTGIDLQPGEAVAEPDIIVPFQDPEWHVAPDVDFHFIWEDYSWDPSEVGMEYDMADGHALVIGTGCMPNCNMALINAYEGTPDYDHAGLHRSKDPGVTGFTGFYNQKMITSREIPAGGEIFVNYGEPWFVNRGEEFGFVPFEKNFKRVDKLLKKFKKRSLKIQTRAETDPDFTRDLWDLVSLHSRLFPETKNSNALPLTFEDMQYAQAAGSAESRLPYSVRTIEWLHENARCMDNIRPGNSTIEQAGRGAFASRFIPEGGLVAPGPVLHIPNRTALTLYEEGEGGFRDPSKPVGMQLITNYCFGHRESTVILCPYTSPSAYINHNGKSPNAKVVWAKEGTPNHNPFWLEENVDFLKKTEVIGLSIDFIATRNIQPGEEVFIDYGPEWEKAWSNHVNQWSPPGGSENFEPAFRLQKDLATPLRTETEQQSEPYPPNVAFYCHYGYEPYFTAPGSYEWEDLWEYLHVSPCRITDREYDEVDKQYYYTVRMLDLSELKAEFGVDNIEESVNIPPGEQHILTDVPRWAIEIRDKPYSKDEFLPNPFRHEMMMPDDIFPDTWKNLREKHTQSKESPNGSILSYLWG